MKKYWIAGFVVICLCVAIATVFGQTQSYKGTQWEYGCYRFSLIAKTGPRSVNVKFTWTDKNGNYESQESGQDCWRQAGFNSGDKKVTRHHWFNFLGGKGWELVSADEGTYYTDNSSITKDTYWFKRPKR